MRKKPPASPPLPPARGPFFIDSIEEGKARVLLRLGPEHMESHVLSAALLPADAREGAWIELTVRVVPPPEGEDARALRRLLGRGDPGGDFEL